MICYVGKNAIDLCKIYKPDCIICNLDDIGVDTWRPSLKKYAIENNIKIVSLEDVYPVKNLVFVSVEFDKLINPKLFASKKLINVHYSLLPKYRGCLTSIWPILNGETKSGVTIHLIDDGIDTGPILDQIEFDIDINDTARDLYFKYMNTSKDITIDLNSSSESILQPILGTSYYSSRSLDLMNIKIDLNKTSFEIHNQIRAFIFPEYQLPTLFGRKITSSILTNEFIGRNKREIEDKMIISGMDGYKIELTFKNNDDNLTR
jgi:methionyl-tRNA formyltransferase